MQKLKVKYPASARAQKYSKNPTYHEHSLLDRGMCVEACVNLVNSFNSSLKATFDTEPITVKPYHLLSIPSEQELPQHVARYGRILNVCVNYHLQQRYNLTGYSVLERCITADSHRPALDAYHVLFGLIVVILCGVVGYASCTDWRHSQTPSNNNNETDHKTTAGRDGFWTEFSLRRTWTQLIGAPKSNLQRDFAFVEIFRMLSVLIILAIHVSMCFTAGPTANMRPLEEFYARTLSLIAVHTFFTISGIMLAVHFLEHAATKTHRIGWSFLWKGIVMRQLRFVFYAHPALKNDYMLSHPHTCSYFSGLFAGIAYHRYRKASIPALAKGTTAWLLKRVPPTLVLLQAAFSPLFYGLDYSEPMLWNAIYGAVHRCCWGAMCATGILYGATVWQGRHSWLLYHPVLQTLSKLSFGAFMVQFNVLKSLTQNATGNGIDFSWKIFEQPNLNTMAKK
uniref:Acyltransferase 3 domain-containing protein n=1 Tax=Anopheles maculatus TaxID=74869 RepID=A0A182TBS5_9DIPT